MFTNFYLRNIAGQQGELLTLPPLMTAGSVINYQENKKQQKKKKTHAINTTPGASL